jgi:hypothetical protein
MTDRSHLWPFVAMAIIAGVALLMWLSVMIWPSHAREGGNWSEVPPEVREWMGTLKMPDMPSTSCCGPADAYEADMGEVGADGQNYAIITGTRGNPLPVGTKLLILPSKVQNKQGNPSGHVIVFANTSGTVYCFIPGGTG